MFYSTVVRYMGGGGGGGPTHCFALFKHNNTESTELILVKFDMVYKCQRLSSHFSFGLMWFISRATVQRSNAPCSFALGPSTHWITCPYHQLNKPKYPCGVTETELKIKEIRWPTIPGLEQWSEWKIKWEFRSTAPNQILTTKANSQNQNNSKRNTRKIGKYIGKGKRGNRSSCMSLRNILDPATAQNKWDKKRGLIMAHLYFDSSHILNSGTAN
jgi:hypothetical protein